MGVNVRVERVKRTSLGKGGGRGTGGTPGERGSEGGWRIATLPISLFFRVSPFFSAACALGSLFGGAPFSPPRPSQVEDDDGSPRAPLPVLWRPEMLLSCLVHLGLILV